MFFKGNYYYLSNMCKFDTPIVIDGITYKTAENYYQSMKTLSNSERVYIASINPAEAKKHTRTIKIRDDWDKVKLDVMTKIIDIKFNIPIFRYLLLSTKEIEIVEDNYWHDTYWGVCEGIGENHLGKILMDKRDKLNKMIEVKRNIKLGNLYTKENMDNYDYIGFTSNSTVKNNGELVMGAGTAKEIKELYPELPSRLGVMVKLTPSFIVDEETKIFAIRTKTDYKLNSNISLIIESLAKLKEHATIHSDKKYAMPVPGISNGGLDIYTVLPYLVDLPSNIDIWQLPEVKIYTGIGNRDIPVEYQERIKSIAKALSDKGYTLRSGGANGSDTCFEQEAGNRTEIYLPWKGFNKSTSMLFNQSNACNVLASLHHNKYNELKDGVKKLISRNMQQVLGSNLNQESDFLVCYTEDGCNTHKKIIFKTGGTATAISLASIIGIPIYNIRNKTDYAGLLKLIHEIK